MDINKLKIAWFFWQFGLWQVGLVESVSFRQFCINCAVQYTTLAVTEGPNYTNNTELSLKVALAPIHGFGTAFEFIRTARGAKQIKDRYTFLGSYMMMSACATGSDISANAAAGAAVSTCIGHMKRVIKNANLNNTTKALLFLNVSMLSKLTNDDLFIIDKVIISGLLLIFLITVSSYVLPRIAKASWNYSKKLAQEIKYSRKNGLKSRIFIEKLF